MDVVELAWPFTGPWLVQMSPADRVPSHGTELFATRYAIDFVPVDDDGRSLRRNALGRVPASEFVGFGRPVLSPVRGVVVTAYDDEPDHEGHRGLSLLRYLATQRRRLESGWRGLAGNHLIIRAGGVYVALCHLQRGSQFVSRGQPVEVGRPVAACGNSGNSTEPHLHLQAITDPDPTRAEPLPIRFPTGLPRNGEVVTG